MERNSFTVTSLLLFLPFVERCRAQVSDSGTDTGMIIAISLPCAIFFVVVMGICIVFWCCYCRVSMLAKHPHQHRRPQYAFNYPRPHQTVSPQNQATVHSNSSGQSHSIETTTSSSTNLNNSTQTGVNSSTTQSAALSQPPQPAQAYSRQAHTSPPIAIASSIPPAAPGATQSESQTAPQSSEPVSQLPEATLHQGDAPPAYAEAVKMKTVIVIDET